MHQPIPKPRCHPKSKPSSEGSPGQLQHPCAARQGHKTQACVSLRGGLPLPGHVRSWFALLGPWRGWGKPALILLPHPIRKRRRCWTSRLMEEGKKKNYRLLESRLYEAAAVPDALKISRGPQPLAASPVWGQGSPTITHGAPSGDPKDACPVIWGGRGCSPACCDALRSSVRACQPAPRRPSASSHGQTCRDKARLLAVEMGPWVPFQLSKQEQNPLSTGSARGPGARRPPVPSIVPRGSRAGCSWGQQHLWDLAPALPLAPSGAG